MADGTVNIDILVNQDKLDSGVSEAKAKLKTLGDEAGNSIDDNISKNMDKSVSDVDSGVTKVKTKLKDIPAETRAKIVADAKIAGIENFDKILKDIPSEKLTKLVASVQEGKAADYEDIIKSIPTKKVTQLKLNDNASSGLKNLQSEAKTTKNRFSELKTVLLGTFAGQLLASGMAELQTKIGELIESGVEYNKTVQTSYSSWTTLTNSSSKGQKMVDMATSLSNHFGQARDVVDELDQQFYHVLDNSSKTQTLTTSFLTLADTIGLSSAQVQTLGQDFTHTLSSGYVQLSDFNQLTDYLPMFGNAMLKYEQKIQNNSKLTMSQLRNEMSANKISAQDAMAVINQLGTKYKASADNMLSTLPGMERAIQTKAPQLVSDFITPFLKAENPIAKMVMKWMDDSSTSKELTNAGKSFSKSLNGISQSIVDAFPDLISIGKSLASIAGTVGKTVWKTFGSVMGTIASMFDKTSSKASGSKKPLDNVANALEAISKHKSAISTLTKVFLAMLAISKIAAFNSKLGAMASGFSNVSKNMSKLTSKGGISSLLSDLKPSAATIFALAIVAIGVAFYDAYKHIKPFREWVNNILKLLKEFGKKAYDSYIKPAITDIMKTFDKWGDQLSSFWSKNGKPLEKALQNFAAVMKVVYLGITVTLGAMEGVFEATFAGIIREVRILWTTVKSLFSGGFEVLKGLIEIFEGVFTGNWSKIKQGGIDVVKGMWTAISGLFKGAVDTLGNLALTVAQAIINGIIGGLNAGIGAIDDVIHTFGGSKNAIGKISKVKLAAGTGVFSGNRRPITQRTLALLNDGNDSPETGNKEMVIKANGDAGVVQGKNVTAVLDPGDEVLNASETKYLMNSLGVERFASGTGFWSKIASGATKLFDSVVDKLSSIGEAISNPVKFVEALLTKHSSFDSANAAIKIGSSMINGIAQGIETPIKKLLNKLKESLEGSDGTAVPSSDQKKMMAAAGIPSSWYDDMSWIVSKESGWKTNATNASSGAYGLPQALPGSKMASAGSDWKTNPVTQLKWMYSYVKNRYGTAANAVSAHKAKGWYANGGDVSEEGLYGLAEGNQKEFVVPNPTVAGIDRSYAVLGQAAAYLGAKGNAQSNNSSVLETAVNKLVALQSAANSKLEKSINKKVQVVLDTGKMVGAMYSKIDQTGYSANSYQQRNVWG